MISVTARREEQKAEKLQSAGNKQHVLARSKQVLMWPKTKKENLNEEEVICK